MKKYTPFFDHNKLTETFDSQKQIYDIVEDITKLLKKLLNIGIVNYKELGDKYIEVGNYYSMIIRPDDGDEFISASFNFKSILSKISHRNGAYVEIVNFYDSYPHAFLRLEFGDKIEKNKAYYEPRSKNIVVLLNNNFDAFQQKISKEGIDSIDINIALHQLFASNDFEERLVHEMTHMYDDIISKQKAVTKAAYKYTSADDDVNAYMANQIEINARFYSAVYASERNKLQICTSQAALKYQWERKYWDSINSTVKLSFLSKEQQAKIYKRAWVEFTTLSPIEEKLMSVISKQTIINNGDIKKLDVRIKNKNNVVKNLKQDFIDLSKGKIPGKVFNKRDPFENEEFTADEIRTKQEMLRQLEMKIEWDTLYYFHDFYKLISKYDVDKYSTELIGRVLKDLRLEKSIVNDIKLEYGIA